MAKNKKKYIVIGLLSLVAVALLAISTLLYFVYSPAISLLNKEEVVYLHVPEHATFSNVISDLETKATIEHRAAFFKLATMLDYDKKIKVGRYKVEKGMSFRQFFTMLTNGLQTPARITFNNIRTKEQLSGRLAEQLMADSLDILNVLNDSAFLSQYEFTTETAVCAFLPNTYEVYWNIDAYKLFERMLREYRAFWTDERKEKARKIPLTETEVSILASIVEEETNVRNELAVVAGVYINRLKRGMLLQADPTVKYAIGDFNITRVLAKHLATDSPYNTYQYAGLPPGPIRIPSGRTIDAVLNYEKHDYIYMCAKETLNGEHNFAKTLSEHNKNARKYQRALNQLRIYR